MSLNNDLNFLSVDVSKLQDELKKNTISLWLDTSYQMRAALKDNIQTDFVIIGGGITGTSFAYHLSQAGQNVVLLESQEIASKASGRNGGLFTSGSDESLAMFKKNHGKKASESFNFTLQTGLEEVYQFGLEHKICDPSARKEAIIFAESDSELPILTKWDEPGSVSLSNEAISKFHLPIKQAKKLPGGVHLNPAQFVRAVAKKSEQQGAQIFEETLVTGWEKVNNTYRVKVNNGAVIECSNIILATNAYTRRFLKVPIVPGRNQVIAASTKNLSLNEMFYSAGGWRYFLKTTSDHLVVGGARNMDLKREQSCIDALNKTIQSFLSSYANKISGQPNIKISHRWSGIIAITPDKLPLIGALQDGVHIAAGFSGNGLVPGWSAGRDYSRYLIGKDFSLPIQVFNPNRFNKS